MATIGYFCVYEIPSGTATMGYDYDHAASVEEFLFDSGVMRDVVTQGGTLIELNIDKRDGKDVQEDIAVEKYNLMLQKLQEAWKKIQESVLP